MGIVACLLRNIGTMATSEAPPSYSAHEQVHPLVMVQGGAEGLPQGVTPVVMVSHSSGVSV